MASTRKTNPKAVPSGPGSAQTADVSALPFDMDLARKLVVSSLGGAQSWLRFLEQTQRAQLKALQEMATIFDGAADEARRADGPQVLLALQANLLNAQMARATQAWVSILANGLDAGTQLAEQSGQEALRLSRQMVDGAAAPPAPATAGTLADPLAVLGGAQDAMTQWTQRWVEMVKDASARAQLAQL